MTFFNFFAIILWMTYYMSCSATQIPPQITQSKRSATHSTYDCPRIRKAWHLLSPTEKQHISSALLEFRSTSDFEHIAAIHSPPYTRIVHQSSANYFWHEYLLWEVESRIRVMHPQYKCFAMPYYDFTIDFGRELDPIILSEPQYFGGFGDPDNAFAVNSYSWKISNTQWSVPYKDACVAKGDIFPDACSIKRIPVAEEQVGFVVPGTKEIAKLLTSDEYKNYEDMHREMGYKNMALNMFAGSKEIATIHVAQPYEPIWFLFHSFARYELAMWTSCHGYDSIDIGDIHNHPEMYVNYCGGPKTNENFYYIDCQGFVDELRNGVDKQSFLEFNFDFGLDAVLDFHPLNEQEWSYVHDNDVTIRELYDLSSWGIQYEIGTFGRYSDIQETCKNKLNPDWFIDNNALYEEAGSLLYVATQYTYFSYGNYYMLFIAILFVICGTLIFYYKWYCKTHLKEFEYESIPDFSDYI